MENTKETIKELRITSKKVIFTSFAVDLVDVIINLIVTILSGSVIMLTEVLEGLSDLVSSGFLIIGFYRSSQKEDESHPFGYGTEIYFWSLLSALIMFGLTSSLSFYFGLQRVLDPKPISNTGIALIVLFLAVITNGYAFVLSFLRLLRRRPIKHIVRIFFRSSLVETKTTFTLDLMGTSSAFLGAIALGIYLFTGDQRVDGIGAMIIGIVLAIFSFFLILGIRDLLIGKSASRDTENKIINAALKITEVEDILDIKTLHIGTDKLLVNLFVQMKSKLATRELEQLIDKIEDSVRKEVPSAKYVQVELESSRNRRI
jgi:cation diffusion facilitator family transporter